MSEIVLPPTAPMFEVVSPQEAIRVLCLCRPSEFRLVESQQTTITRFAPVETISTPVLSLEVDHGPGWTELGSFLYPVTFGVISIDDWSACPPVASFLHALGLGFISGFDLEQPARLQDWWMVHVKGQPPLIRRGLSQSEAAIMVYAELIRQRLAS